MNSKRLLISTLLLVLLSSLQVFAIVPPRHRVNNIVQSDGTSLTVHRVTTGERSVACTSDGYLISKNANGDYCYVESINGDHCVLTATIARNPDLRTDADHNMLSRLKKAREIITELEVEESHSNGKHPMRRTVGDAASAPLIARGTPSIPVILVQFSDKSFTSAPAGEVSGVFDKYCNGDGENEYYSEYSYGSVSEYFRDQSNGKFVPQFKVLGPVTLPKPSAYYGMNVGNRLDVNINEFFSGAIRLAKNEEEDWSVFDNDKDGVIDMAFFIFAGEGENAHAADSTDLIWPKELPMGGTIDGMQFGCYACCNETYKGKLDGIGVFVHELSHSLGLPDTYDKWSIAYGMDSWDIMDYGCYMSNGKRPVCYTGYEKDFVNWQKLVPLNPSKPQKVTLLPISRHGDSYKITNPENSNEYYWLENRQNESWDYNVGYSLGGMQRFHHGMLVCHVDYSASAWRANNINNDANHQRMTIVPANGELKTHYFVGQEGYYDMIEYLDNQAAMPFPGSKGVTELTDLAKVYVGGTMNQPICDIEETNGVITFKYCVTDRLESPVIATEEISETLTWNEVEGATEYRMLISTDEVFSSVIDTISTTTPSATVNISQYIPEGSDDIDLYVKVQARADLMLNSVYSNTVHLNKNITAIEFVADENEWKNTDVEIYSVSGVTIAHGKISQLCKELPKGVYILKAGNRVKKICVE